MPTAKGAARPRAAPPKRAPRAAPDAVAAELGRIEARLAALHAEVAALRGGSEAPPDAGSLARDLREGLGLLQASLQEVPKAQDFEPLADHLYSFAQIAPRLLEALESVQRAVGPVEAAAATLGDVADTLMAIHQSWSESLLRLPRAEDYEPLAAPLREFARVSPALAETLGSVVRAVTPLPELVRELTAATRALQGLRPAAPAGGGGDLRLAAALAADELGAARAALRSALGSLPRDPAYARFAAQLRELATVSPSLMEWLSQVPSLSLPLGETVALLEETAQKLEEAEQATREALDTPWEVTPREKGRRP